MTMNTERRNFITTVGVAAASTACWQGRKPWPKATNKAINR
ncbi:MAG TPA: twin-arginine translocation signal domain-containing protein [Steroidobacteraceae bacterium]|jgi:hypothetical protein|nr:twin-arginine translocation signal domain-containing protein [Steroidobacteraceae bacterium]